MRVKAHAMKIGLIALLGLGAVALAQRPFAGGFHGMFGAGKVVTGVPYSATAVTTHTQTLSNGNTINQSSCVNVYRDSSGRTRRDETRNSATCSTTPQTILINDPVAGVGYIINTQNSTYRQYTIKAPSTTTTTPPTPPANPNQVVTTLTPITVQLTSGGTLTADGTQTVTTIPAGRFGNTQAITITSTRYYTSTLQVVVQSSRTDPRNGTTTYQLSNISTAEPAESLFQLPSGLTLQQGPGARGHRAP